VKNAVNYLMLEVAMCPTTNTRQFYIKRRALPSNGFKTKPFNGNDASC
jgi:hypothetical protein